MDLVAPLVAPALSQKPAFVTYFVARGAPRPCYIPEGFDSLPYVSIVMFYLIALSCRLLVVDAVYALSVASTLPLCLHWLSDFFPPYPSLSSLSSYLLHIASF